MTDLLLEFEMKASLHLHRLDRVTAAYGADAVTQLVVEATTRIQDVTIDEAWTVVTRLKLQTIV